MAPVASDSSGAFPFYAGSVRIDSRRHMGVEIEGTYKSDDAQYQWGPGRITVVGTDNKETLVPYSGATIYTSDSWWETTIQRDRAVDGPRLGLRWRRVRIRRDQVGGVHDLHRMLGVDLQRPALVA